MFAVDAVDPALRSSFGAEATSYQFADIALTSGRASAAIFERSSQAIARSGFDNICLLVYTKGGCALDAEGRAAEVAPGDVCFLDLSRPVSLRAPDYESLTLIMPRAAIESSVADVDGLHGRILRKSSPLSAMLVSHLRALFAEAPTLDAVDGRAAATGTASLIAAFAGPSDGGREAIARAKSGAPLRTFRQFIEGNLGNHDLGPESMCRELGVSRAKLFRAFEPMGGVRSYILQRRLTRARHLITDPTCAHMRVGAIAAQCGFSSISVFSRAFQNAFGASPTELRRASHRTDMSDAVLAGDRAFGTMSQWLLGVGV